MTPRTELKAANGFMLSGAVLVPISFYRFLAMVSPAPCRIGSVWSLRVEKRHPSAQVSGTFAVRILVFIVVFIPLVIGSF